MGVEVEDEPSFSERYREYIVPVKHSIHILRQNRLTVLGVGILLAMVLVAVLAPVVAPYPQDRGSVTHLQQSLEPPSAQHLFGTDRLGRDIFSRVLFGIQISLRVAVIVVGASLSIGIPLGLVAGYIGGYFELVIMRVTDMFVSIPRLLLPVAIAGALGANLTNITLALIVTWWPWYVRLLRSEIKEVKEKEFIEAAEGVGASRIRVMFVHLLPNSVTSVLVQATMDMGWAILVTAALSFIGIGASPPTPELGLMVTRGRKFLPSQWWWSFFPGLFIFIAVFAINLIGDGLRDILDPKSRLE